MNFISLDIRFVNQNLLFKKNNCNKIHNLIYMWAKPKINN